MEFYYKLDNYCIFIASRYFNSIEDFINLEKSGRRFRGNLEKFHYNPIAVDEKTITFFPFLKTLHLYERNAPFITYDQIEFYCVWFPLEYNDYLTWKQTFPNLISKRVYYQENKKGSSNITIPKEVNELIDISFSNVAKTLQRLVINHPIKYISRDCLLSCQYLRELKIPNNWNVCGNLIFIEDNKLKSLILPQSNMMRINGKQYTPKALKEYTIPHYVTSIDNRCFKHCCSLTNLTIPSYCQTYGKWCFNQCPVKRTHFPLIKEMERKQIKLTEKQITQLEEWTQLKMNEILFDDKEDDVFSLQTILKNKRNIIILFETERNLRIGCFIGSKIQIDQSFKQRSTDFIPSIRIVSNYAHPQFMTDSKAFLFTMKGERFIYYPIKKDHINEAYRFQWYPFPSIQFGKEDITLFLHFNGYFCSFHQIPETSTFQYLPTSKSVIKQAYPIISFKIIQFV